MTNSAHSTGPKHPGNSQHPEHEQWLLELGRATYAASRVAGICFDLARVFGNVDSAAMYSDPLGALINRLQPLGKRGSVPGLDPFIAQLESARDDRNDLLHALPVADGLHRRKSKEPYYVRNFFDVAELQQVTRSLSEAAHRGNELLYHDGGAAVQAWYQGQL
ncbi:hypothetical protein [Ornithinimicrobium flavum]|uniref:hypothetical protein n=1 Tax=Ornithinimicrobium flavum TaxID=1288636 RepID=UPI00106F4626|nr:hypothetical protein [Ornithinimicrobium flavum]